MPKVKALSSRQREEEEIQHLSDGLLQALAIKCAAENKYYMEVAEEVGLSRDQYQRWRANGIGSARVDTAVVAAYRAGYRLELVPIHGQKIGKRDSTQAILDVFEQILERLKQDASRPAG